MGRPCTCASRSCTTRTSSGSSRSAAPSSSTRSTTCRKERPSSSRPTESRLRCETREIIDVLRARFPQLEGPAREDICYATSNRQWAVKELLDEVSLLLVVGSHNSSNSLRLVEVARAAGVEAHLVDDAAEIEAAWLEDVDVVGVTSGASAPERLVAAVCD